MAKPYFRKSMKTTRRFMLDEAARVSGLGKFVGTRMALREGQKELFQRIPDDYYFKSPVRLKSALCCSLVIHALLTLDMQSEVTTRELNKYLNDKYPQILWDPVSVGKILGRLVEHSERLFELRDDFDWGVKVPFSRIKRPSGNMYYFGENELHTLAWFHALLFELAPYAEAERLDPRDTAIKKGGWAGELVTAIDKAAITVENKMLDTNNRTRDAIWDAYPDLWVFATTPVRGKPQRPHDPVYDRPIVSIVQ